jgi:flagellar hook protein FlgE
MSLFGALFSGVTGLNGQSRSMAVISENIANMNTVGYKANTTQFSTLLAGATTSRDMSTAGVVAKNKPLVHQQGQVQLTDNATDLAITGDGFFVVTDSVNGTKANGETMFTRAGSFQPDAHGNFANSGGFYLLGWRLDSDGNAIDGQGTPSRPTRRSPASSRP